VGSARGGDGIERRTRSLKMCGMEGEKEGVRSGWKWVMLKSSLRVSESAIRSMGLLCSCDGRGADLEYRAACRVRAPLMESARPLLRTRSGYSRLAS
jgi:hypothetical protein